MAGEEIIIDELVTENNEAMVHSPEWYQRLKTAVDNLIVNDFGRLVQILYRADVPEQ